MRFRGFVLHNPATNYFGKISHPFGMERLGWTENIDNASILEKQEWIKKKGCESYSIVAVTVETIVKLDLSSSIKAESN